MESERINYNEYRSWVLEDYFNCLDDRGWTPAQAAAFCLEDASLNMVRDDRIYALVIITVAIACLREGFLPDYLASRIDRLPDLAGQLDEYEAPTHRDDKLTLAVLRRSVDFTVVSSDRFGERVDLLLAESPAELWRQKRQ
ncbi:MAG: hypothetical protein LBL55_01030 [Propionibacteriaceae bacterium]|nr:hypothetical protein [Propionibacteriaceae bacterium]